MPTQYESDHPMNTTESMQGGLMAALRFSQPNISMNLNESMSIIQPKHMITITGIDTSRNASNFDM